jgi:hypothetical protein
VEATAGKSFVMVNLSVWSHRRFQGRTA